MSSRPGDEIAFILTHHTTSTCIDSIEYRFGICRIQYRCHCTTFPCSCVEMREVESNTILYEGTNDESKILNVELVELFSKIVS